MEWSAAVRRDPPRPTPSPLPRLQLDSLRLLEENDTSLSNAVIDANALISFDSSARLLALAFSSSSPPRLVSVKEVLEEVRAPASRLHLASLPFSVECIDPTEEALRKVVKFARETGDLHSLSDVDLKLLALTYMLEEQTYGSAHLRSRPPPVQVTQVKHIRERDLPGWGANVQNLEEWEQLSQEADEKGDQGSRILGLKQLSLDTLEQGNIEEQKHVPQESNGIVCQEPNLHGSLDEKWVASSEVIEKQENVKAHNFQNVNGFGQEEVSNVATNDSGDAHDALMESKPGYEHPAALVLDAEGEVVSQEEGEWQRSISRSTRRKHERRAARAATRDLVLTKVTARSIESIHSPTNDMDQGSLHKDYPCPDNDECSSSLSNEGEDAEKAAIDERNNADKHQDKVVSDEDDPSISEEEEPVSIHQTQSEASWTLRPLSQSKVACVTADFPMQNVLLQMGLRVISPNGLQIQQTHKWALKCEACRNVTSDVGRLFCPKCGNGGTLYKVSITVGPNGVVHTGTRRRSNIRGTRYSIPLPKGGRQGMAENPILREDQLPQKMLRPKKKVSIPDLSSPGEMFAMKSGGKEKIQPPIREALAIFGGKRNPNRCRSKQRG